MTIPFLKYQGAGNDFVIIDNRKGSLQNVLQNVFERMCSRRFGVGADGVILLEEAQGYDFKMVYFNSDGRQSTMCGNGGRCIMAFAKRIGIIENNARFLAVDGAHYGETLPSGEVKLQMMDVADVQEEKDHFIIDTGSPHYVKFTEKINDIDVRQEGRAIRYSAPFKAEGINVNFVQQDKNMLYIRTYERGVEDETFACGTGTVAAAIAAHKKGLKPAGGEYLVKAKGGLLKVSFTYEEGRYSNVCLSGPAEFVFSGEIEI